MMPFIDWVIIVLILIFCILGMLFGFGKGLKFFTGGIVGIIISILICYMLGGAIYNIGFVQNGLTNFRASLASKGNTFCDILNTIHIDIIVYYVGLFIAVTIIRIIIVKIIKNIVEIENMVLIIVNKFFGVVLFVGVFFIMLLIVFFVSSLISGGAEGGLYAQVSQSKIGLKELYENNPFMTIIQVIKIRIEHTVVQ